MSVLPLLKALADPTRLRLVSILARTECTVQELTTILAMGQSRISRHLKILVEAGILAVQRQGTWGYYRTVFSEPLFTRLWSAVTELETALPDQGEDLVRLAAVLEGRRRRSREFFDRHARQWDDLAVRLVAVDDFRPLLLEWLPECRRLVEIGIGTGRLLPDLVRPGRQVIGIDQSPAMLEQARSRLVEAGLEGSVELRLGEMTHLPLADRTADGALLTMALHHAPQPQQVIAELGRILEPAGFVLIVDLQRHDQEWTRDQLADQWLGFTRRELEAWLTDASVVPERYLAAPPTDGRLASFLLLARKPDSPSRIHRKENVT